MEGWHRSRGSIPPSGSIPDDPLGDTQGGRPRLAPRETPRVDARVSPLNFQDHPNHLSHIPNGFESNVFALVSFDFVCLLWCCFSTPLGRAVLWEVRCMPRRLCVGAQGFVAFGNVQRWGGGFPLEVPARNPQGFDQRFPQRSPKGFLRAPQGLPPRVPRGVPQGCPQGCLQGFPRDS